MSKKLSIRQYSTIILDCDGVILNSNNIKTRAFLETIEKYDYHSKQRFINYHIKNIGKSRFIKFEFFFKNIIKRLNYSTEYKNSLKNFSKILKQRLIESEIDESIYKLIDKNKKKKFFVISASEQKELKFVFRKIGLRKYFSEVYGSPLSKTENLSKIKKKE